MYWNTASEKISDVIRLAKDRNLSEEALTKGSKALLNLHVEGVDSDAVETVTKIAIGLREQAIQSKTLVSRSLLMGFQNGKDLAVGTQEAVKFGLQEGETTKKRFRELDNAATITRATLQLRYSVSLKEIGFGAWTGTE